MISSKGQVEVQNIPEYVNWIYSELFEFVKKFGDYHLKAFIEDHHTAIYLCGIRDGDTIAFRIGIRKVTYHEYCNGKVGICVNHDVPCPYKKNCPAFKNSNGEQ